MSVEIRARLGEQVSLEAKLGGTSVTLSMEHLLALASILQGKVADHPAELRQLFDAGILRLGPPPQPTADDIAPLLGWDAAARLYLDPQADLTIKPVGGGLLQGSDAFVLFIAPELAKALGDLSHDLRSLGATLWRNSVTRGAAMDADEWLRRFEKVYRDACARAPLNEYLTVQADVMGNFQLIVKQSLQLAYCPYAEAEWRACKAGHARAARLSATIAVAALPAVAQFTQRLQTGMPCGEIASHVLESEHAPYLLRVLSTLVRGNLITQAPPQQPDWDAILPPEKSLSVFHLGHAGLLVRGGETSVVVDPWFLPNDPQFRVQPLQANQLPPLAAIFLTHEHFDHVNVAALLRYPRDVPVIVPQQDESSPLYPRYREFLHLFGIERVFALGHWQQQQFAGGMTVTAIPFHGEGTAEEGAGRNCYLIERKGKRAFVHVDSSIDSFGQSDLTQGTIARMIADHGPVDVLYGTRRQDLYYGYEFPSDLMPVFLGMDPARIVKVAENCYCPASYIAELAQATGCAAFMLYSEGGAEWYPEDTNFLRQDGEESSFCHDYLWDSLEKIRAETPVPVHVSLPLDVVHLDSHGITHALGSLMPETRP